MSCGTRGGGGRAPPLAGDGQELPDFVNTVGGQIRHIEVALLIHGYRGWTLQGDIPLPTIAPTRQHLPRRVELLEVVGETDDIDVALVIHHDPR